MTYKSHNNKHNHATPAQRDNPSKEEYAFNFSNLRSPSMDSSICERPQTQRAANNNEKRVSSVKQKRQQTNDEELSPISKFRQPFLFYQKTSRTKAHHVRDVINVASSSEDSVSEPDLEPGSAPTPIPLRQKTKIPIEKPKRVRGRPREKSATAKQVRQKPQDSPDQLALPSHVAPKQKGKKSVLQDILNVLEKGKEMLASLAESGKLAEFLEADGGRDATIIQQLRAHCAAATQLLQVSNENGAGVPSTIEYYDQLFLYLAKSNFVYLLQPVHVFAGNKWYSRKKTFGLVRLDKNSPPLICTISGDTNCADPHPMLMDVKLWTEEVKHWAAEHGHIFQTGNWDKRHGKSPGHYHATHVEPRLMLWTACYMANQRLGHNKHEHEQIKRIWELKDFADITAEILISHSNGKPCRPCIAFQKDIEKFTGIRFNILSCPNLGQLKMERGKSGQNEVPLYASDSEQEGDEDEDLSLPSPLISSTSRSVQVVIRSSKSSTTTTTTVAKRSAVVSSGGRIDVYTNPFRYVALQKVKEMKAKKRARHGELEDEDSDDTAQIISPPTKKHKHKRY